MARGVVRQLRRVARARAQAGGRDTTVMHYSVRSSNVPRDRGADRLRSNTNSLDISRSLALLPQNTHPEVPSSPRLMRASAFSLSIYYLKVVD